MTKGEASLPNEVVVTGTSYDSRASYGTRFRAAASSAPLDPLHRRVATARTISFPNNATEGQGGSYPMTHPAMNSCYSANEQTMPHRKQAAPPPGPPALLRE